MHGVGFVECLELFARDEQTAAVVLVGEIGGDDEERAAEFVAIVRQAGASRTSRASRRRPGKRMGHAGAIISGGTGTAAAKKQVLEEAGVPVAAEPGRGRRTGARSPRPGVR